jgi:hypothetical protein
MKYFMLSTTVIKKTFGRFILITIIALNHHGI